MENNTGGGLTSYYVVQVENPQRSEQPAYQAECEDIIEALQLNFDEGNIFKEIWRTANGRIGNGKPNNNPLRAAEKIVHYANRIHLKALRTSADEYFKVSYSSGTQRASQTKS